MLLYLFLIGIGLLCVSIVWRVSTSRHSIPCPDWLYWLVELDNPIARNNRSETIIRNADLQEGMALLDIGCGPGRVTIPAAVKVGQRGKVVALDVQPGMLNLTREKAKKKKLGNINFLQIKMGEGEIGGKFESANLGKMKFDRALLVTVLGEIPKQETALKEIFEVLKPGGILSVTETIFDPHVQSYKKVSRLAKSIGFHEKTQFGNWLSFTINLEKPLEKKVEDNHNR